MRKSHRRWKGKDLYRKHRFWRRMLVRGAASSVRFTEVVVKEYKRVFDDFTENAIREMKVWY